MGKPLARGFERCLVTGRLKGFNMSGMLRGPNFAKLALGTLYRNLTLRLRQTKSPKGDLW